MINKIKAALFGLSVGDALGVPVEFKSRAYLNINPVKTMVGYGTWNQPPGTWSDDSSLAFCLAESLTNGYNLTDIASNFIKWMTTGYWGAHHKLFDIGGATRFAIERLMAGTPPTLSGGITEDDNGNGSLMRILPLVFVVKDLTDDELFQKVKEISSITHGHFRSVFSCFIYIQLAKQLLNGATAINAYETMKMVVNKFIEKNQFNKNEIKHFNKILKGNIQAEKETNIYSGGYVLQTIEASIWCLLNTNNYTDAVLKAVNLGNDTDTTACVTGGLAGLLYGYENIPDTWLQQLARKQDISDLCDRLNKKISLQ